MPFEGVETEAQKGDRQLVQGHVVSSGTRPEAIGFYLFLVYFHEVRGLVAVT